MWGQDWESQAPGPLHWVGAMSPEVPSPAEALLLLILPEAAIPTLLRGLSLAQI